MSRLIESIHRKDFVKAHYIFEDRMNIIVEKKLYEEKRRIAADMNEAYGGMTRSEYEERKKAGYRKATDVLGDPSKIKIKPLVKVKKKKKISEESLDEAGLAPTGVGKLYRAGLKAGGSIGAAAGEVYSAAKGAKHKFDVLRRYTRMKTNSSKPSSQSPFPQSMFQTQNRNSSSEPDEKKKKEKGVVAGIKAAASDFASQYGG